MTDVIASGTDPNGKPIYARLRIHSDGRKIWYQILEVSDKPFPAKPVVPDAG